MQQPKQVLIGLRLESRRAARAGEAVTLQGRTVGTITSGSLAPSVGVAVAMAYVDVAQAPMGGKLDVVSRGAVLPATVVDVPFYTGGTARNG